MFNITVITKKDREQNRMPFRFLSNQRGDILDENALNALSEDSKRAFMENWINNEDPDFMSDFIIERYGTHMEDNTIGLAMMLNPLKDRVRPAGVSYKDLLDLVMVEATAMHVWNAFKDATIYVLEDMDHAHRMFVCIDPDASYIDIGLRHDIAEYQMISDGFIATSAKRHWHINPNAKHFTVTVRKKGAVL